MKPWVVLAQAGDLRLRQRGAEFAIDVDGKLLMGSRRHGSELALAELGLAYANRSTARVLIGGLGMGFTLRAVLDAVGPKARIEVAELSGAVIEWNRGPLAPLAGAPLSDPRVVLHEGDVLAVAKRSPAAFDAVLLDVDNGPHAISRPANAALYGQKGLATFAACLAPGGALSVWSAGDDGRFSRTLDSVGLGCELLKTGDGQHVVFRARPAARLGC